MPLSNLYATVYYRTTRTGCPIALLMHGWDGQAISDVVLRERLALAGFFVVGVGMRGRDGADGARDASGREIHDIYDALQEVRRRYARYVSPDRAVLVGYSGGGGNVLAAGCKFPDSFAALISFYGMSDYGRDATNGWYQNCNWAPYRTDMEAAIGGSPSAVPNAYYARDATAAIANYSGGRLILFHDTGDGVVPVVHSQRIVTALDAAGLTNYQANYTSAADATRWTHGLSFASTAMLAAENIWIPQALAAEAWTVPASGTVTVIGYIVTKRFSIWLGNGLSGAASVTYDTATGTYEVTPLTAGSLAVTVTQGPLSANATITETTTLTVA